MFQLSPLWKIALKNLGRNKRRAAATGVAISAGFIGLMLLGDYVNRVKNILISNTVYIMHVGHISFYKEGALENFFSKPTRYVLSKEDQAQLRQLLAEEREQIEFTSQQLLGAGLITQGEKSAPFVAQGIEPELDTFVRHHPYVQHWTPSFVSGKSLESFAEAVQREPTSISVTRPVAELTGTLKGLLSLHSERAELDSSSRQVQLAARNFYGDLNAVNAEVRLQHTTGVHFIEDTSIITSLQLLQELYATDGLYTLAIFLKDYGQTGPLAKRLREKIQAQHLPIETYEYYDEKVGSMYTGTMSFLYVMSSFFITIIVIAVSLSIVNSLTMGIIERIREIGTLRALGYTPQLVTDLFVKEALLLTTLAILAGTGLSFMIAHFVNLMKIDFNPPTANAAVRFVVTPNLAIGLLVSLCLYLVTYTTSRWVVSRKTRLKTIELLTDSGG